MSPPQVPPTSFILPGGLATDLTYPHDTNYTLAAQGAATFYYSVDGSPPRPTSATTRSGKSPLDLGVVPGGTLIRWYVDYGTSYLAETEHRFMAITSSPAPIDLGYVPGPAQFKVQGADVGPVAVVPPGTPLSGQVRYRAWQSQTTGYCPGCIIQFVVAVDTIGAVGCNNTVTSSGTYPGKDSIVNIAFNAPATPGRYRMWGSLTKQFACDGTFDTGPDIGEVIVE